MAKQIVSVFFLLFSTGFCNEIFQGTLKNGLRYYLLPGSQLEDSTIKLVVKKPKQFCGAGPLIDPFFKEGVSSDECWNCCRKWSCGSEFDHFVYTYKGHLAQNSLADALSLIFKDLIEKKPLPDALIEELKMEHEEDSNNVPPASIQEMLETLWDGDWGYQNLLFTQDNDAINQAYHAIFEPSRMALIIEGPFDMLSAEKILEDTLGKMVGDGIFLSTIKFKPKEPLGFVIETEGAWDFFELDQEEEQTPEEINLIYCYFYQLAPTYKNHVLNDLYFCTKFYEDLEICEEIVGKLRSVVILPSIEPITLPPIDLIGFIKAEVDLEDYYRSNSISDVKKCYYHFLSGIPDKLEFGNQNLLRELEAVSFHEYCSFVEGLFRHVPIHTIKLTE